MRRPLFLHLVFCHKKDSVRKSNGNKKVGIKWFETVAVLYCEGMLNGKKLFVPLLMITMATTKWNKVISNKVLWKKQKAKGLVMSLRFGGQKDERRKHNIQIHPVFLMAIL